MICKKKMCWIRCMMCVFRAHISRCGNEFHGVSSFWFKHRSKFWTTLWDQAGTPSSLGACRACYGAACGICWVSCWCPFVQLKQPMGDVVSFLEWGKTSLTKWKMPRIKDRSTGAAFLSLCFQSLAVGLEIQYIMFPWFKILYVTYIIVEWMPP